MTNTTTAGLRRVAAPTRALVIRQIGDVGPKNRVLKRLRIPAGSPDEVLRRMRGALRISQADAEFAFRMHMPILDYRSESLRVRGRERYVLQVAGPLRRGRVQRVAEVRLHQRDVMPILHYVVAHRGSGMLHINRGAR